MGKPFQLVDTTLLEKAIGAATLRQQVISNNMANVNTEGYTAQTVAFENHLREAMDNDEAAGSDTDFSPAGVVDPEFAIDGAGGWTKASLQPTIEDVGGKVDVNSEMASLAKNQIMYNALASKISGIYGSLKWIVENSGR
ncbi:MAG: flagellar basal body rod protein FlgB [Candidatus Eremiobacteraeota bacterium]|nr:flagellar basal body rod protein FlgB [Candidatus Eremiobacteraeota bacterium]